MKLTNQQGIVSFLVVMFISILLVIITVGFAHVMIREVRQATDDELSTRAFYAAESAVEDGILEVRQAIESGNINQAANSTCDDGTFGTATGYSCRLINVEPNSLEGSLAPNVSRQFTLEGVQHNRIHLDWHLHGVDYSNNTGSFSVPNNNPPADNWPSPTPPMMRLEIVSYPTNLPIFQEGHIEQDVVFLRPSSNNQSTRSTMSLENFSGTGGENSTARVNCDRQVNRDFACKLEVTGFTSGNRNYIVRIRPLYTGTNYRLRALQGNNVQSIPGNLVIIDVTGYATDVFRRVQARVPYYSVDTFGQDYVLLADDDVCKVMRVSRIDGRASTNIGCE